jgi:TolB protein
LYPAWSPDGTRIAFNDNYNGISIIDLTSGSISFVPNTQSTYYVNPSPAWSPDGTKIAFESDLGRETGIVDIFTISPAGNGLTNLTSNIISGDNYIYPAWSPDGTKLCVELISYTNRSIAVMNADGTGLTIIKTTEDDYYESVPSWSPDGTRIAYTESKTIKWVAPNGSAVGTIVTNGWDADWKH